MNDELWLILIAFGVPFASFVVIFCWLVAFNKQTTGEIKQILPSDIFLKVMAIILVVVVTFILAYCRILETGVTAAILGSVVTGTVMSIKQSKNE